MNRRDIIGNTKVKNIPGKIRKKIGPSVSKGIKTVKNFVRGAKRGVKNMTVADAFMNVVAPGSTIVREGVRQVLKKPDKIKVNRAPGKPPKSTTISGPFKMKGFSGFGNNEYKNMIPKKTDKITQKDIDGFIKDMRPGKNDKITQKDIDGFIKDMKKGEHIENLLPKRANATFTKIKRK